MTIEVETADRVTAELSEAFARLLPQLSSSARPLTEETMREVVDCPANTVLVARVDGRIAGTLTLVTFPLPTGVRSWIEDVVVDESARGRGVGEALSHAALEVARKAGARTVDLTSRPSREAANRLYQRVGFQLRDSNVYRYSFG
jgi:ribosomal protein S18 acetylase RimI-like enzyme